MDWNNLTSESELEEITRLSELQPILIFKHSTRCSISSSAKDRIERNWKPEKVRNLKPYYLDLLSYRSVSNKAAEIFSVIHQSPQVLIISKGKAIFDASHLNINFDAIVNYAN